MKQFIRNTIYFAIFVYFPAICLAANENKALKAEFESSELRIRFADLLNYQAQNIFKNNIRDWTEFRNKDSFESFLSVTACWLFVRNDAAVIVGAVTEINTAGKLHISSTRDVVFVPSQNPIKVSIPLVDRTYIFSLEPHYGIIHNNLQPPLITCTISFAISAYSNEDRLWKEHFNQGFVIPATGHHKVNKSLRIHRSIE